jgi:hypothetical protein
MSQRDGDIVQVSGVTVGGEEIGENGGWRGSWQPWAQGVNGKKKEKLKIEVLPATAVLIRLSL